MSEENVEIMREVFAVVNDRGVHAATDDFRGLLPHVSPRTACYLM